MTMHYSEKLGLYLPYEEDTETEVVTSLRENFEKIDTGFEDLVNTNENMRMDFEAFKLSDGIAGKGQNENGSFIRWKNGFQVCWKYQTGVEANRWTSGALWQSSAQWWDFPVPFISYTHPIYVSGDVRSRNQWITSSGAPVDDGAPFRLISTTNDSTKYWHMLIAIGHARFD